MVKFNERLAQTHATELQKQEESLIQHLATDYGLEYINLRGYTINPEALRLVAEAQARAAMLAVFDRLNTVVSVAVHNPNNPHVGEVLKGLEAQALTPRLYMCSTRSLEHAWLRYADINTVVAKKKGVFDFSPENISRFVKSVRQRGDITATMDTISTVNNARRVTETLELIFAGALALNASDIHLEPEDKAIRLRYRLDGVLHDILGVDRYIFERIMSRLKLLSGMTLNKKSGAQDGRFTFRLGERDIELRVSVIPGASGESAVMRLLDPGVASFSMDKLRLNPALMSVMERELKKPDGLIITTGPTGSGKTTALYAFLREVHKEGAKIITIENPVEYKLPGIVQTQTSDEYTFASGLRAVLRQDPDIIMVGEIRDREVAETAIHAAQTGHLVFSTLHTNGAVGSFPRLIDFGIDPRVIGSAINIVLGQRLVRLLCPSCKRAYAATAEESELIARVLKNHPSPTSTTVPSTLYSAGGGCAACGDTGYKGRIGLFEAILVDEAVEEVIIRDPREHIILAAARPQGIPTMVEDGIDKVLKGETSLAELERVVALPRAHPAAMRQTYDEPRAARGST
jgi:type II secretory ATPase GspE/PulE/Tfp pilus assembly ATPase PilB-like protein